MKVAAFGLRPAKHELNLSFYHSSKCEPQDILHGAPEAGWGVAKVRVACLRELGFEVAWDPDSNDLRLGPAHVAATPTAYDSNGQIPYETRSDLAECAEWVILPGTVKYEVSPRAGD